MSIPLPSDRTLRIVALAGTCALLVKACAVFGHEAPQGWSYDAYCCSNKDCRPIPDEWVQIDAKGYIVRIPGAGDGEPTISRHFPYASTRRSGDEHYHACVNSLAKAIRCLYVPNQGV